MGEQIRFPVNSWEFKVKSEAFHYRCIYVWPGEGGKERQGEEIEGVEQKSLPTTQIRNFVKSV